MEEFEMKMAEICEMKNTLISSMKAYLTKGVDSVDTKEAGEVIDMIKDLAQAEKYCYEACYYKTVIEAMDSETEENDRYGYNHNRYSSGRYAPSGRGNYTRGYRPMTKPYIDQMPYIAEYLEDPEEFSHEMNSRRGYVSGMSNMPYSNDGNNRGGYYDGDTSAYMTSDSDYGRAYRNYRNSRRHYTETKSASDKEEMNMHANEHVMNALATIRDVYKDSDPDLKKRMKEDFTKLVSEMTG